MEPLVSVETVKTYLRLVGPDYDAELGLKVVAATAIVIDYIKRPDHAWTQVDVPDVIMAAICEVVGNLMDERQALTEDVKALLWRFRDPAIA